MGRVMYVCKVYKRVSRNETDDHDGMYFCSLGDLPPTTGKTIRGNNQPFKYKYRPETAPGSPETACRLGSAQSTCKGGGSSTTWLYAVAVQDRGVSCCCLRPNNNDKTNNKNVRSTYLSRDVEHGLVGADPELLAVG